MPRKVARAAPAAVSEFGLMHRRVQVEVEWFIALSDAGLAEFTPLAEAARGAAAQRWCARSPRPMPQAIKDIEKTTNHDVKAVEYWLQVALRGHARAGRRRVDSSTSPAPAKTSTTPATR